MDQPSLSMLGLRKWIRFTVVLHNWEPNRQNVFSIWVFIMITWNPRSLRLNIIIVPKPVSLVLHYPNTCHHRYIYLNGLHMCSKMLMCSIVLCFQIVAIMHQIIITKNTSSFKGVYLNTWILYQELIDFISRNQ